MSAEKAPLVNKLVLLVLTLILACLVILIAQQYGARNTPPSVLTAENAANERTETAPPEPIQYAPLRPRSNSAPGSARSPFGGAPAPRVSTAAAPALPGQIVIPEDSSHSRSSSALPADTWPGVHVDTLAKSGSALAGRVSLLGTPPPEKTMEAADPTKMCGGGSTLNITTRHYLVSEDGGLANVFVWIKSGIEKSRLATSSTPVLDQIGCQFEPYVLGVQAGQPFLIRNSDPGLHNVHALPKPGSSNREFNFGMPLRGQVLTRSFPSPELFIRFKCDVHNWMFAYVSVVDHPFFSVTDT